MVLQWVVLPPDNPKASVGPRFDSELDTEFRLLFAWSSPVS